MEQFEQIKNRLEDRNVFTTNLDLCFDKGAEVVCKTISGEPSLEPIKDHGGKPCEQRDEKQENIPEKQVVGHKGVNGGGQTDHDNKTGRDQHSSQEEDFFRLIIQLVEKTIQFMRFKIIRTEFKQECQLIINLLLDAKKIPIQMIRFFN